VEGNIKLQLELRNLDLAEYEDKITNILKSVKLEDFANRYPSELSGGMQQRAAFCQAMIHEPNTILLDEPLGKLDAMTREKIRSDIQNLWMINKPTVIFVTHSIEEAVQLSSRVILISPRPGLVDREINIDLPYPRDLSVKRSNKFFEYVHEIQEVFHEYGVI
jgi:NitT/TauT family transport system ATP-binding protein